MTQKEFLARKKEAEALTNALMTASMVLSAIVIMLVMLGPAGPR